MPIETATENYICSECHQPIKKGDKYWYRESLGEEYEEEYGRAGGELTICMNCKAIMDEQIEAAQRRVKNISSSSAAHYNPPEYGSKWGNRIAFLIVVMFLLALACIIAAAFGVPIPIGGGGHLFGPP